MDKKILTQDKFVNMMPLVSLTILTVTAIVAYFIL